MANCKFTSMLFGLWALELQLGRSFEDLDESYYGIQTVHFFSLATKQYGPICL